MAASVCRICIRRSPGLLAILPLPDQIGGIVVTPDAAESLL
jgi:hypothetical protein